VSVTLKIIALGTSLMATAGWTGEVRSQVEQCARRSVALEVVAESGVTSRWGLAQTPKLIADAVDVLLVEFAANDANLRRFVSLSESRGNHQEIIRAVRKAQPSAKFFSSPSARPGVFVDSGFVRGSTAITASTRSLRKRKASISSMPGRNGT
jgi:hypothetical protein